MLIVDAPTIAPEAFLSTPIGSLDSETVICQESFRKRGVSDHSQLKVMKLSLPSIIESFQAAR